MDGEYSIGDIERCLGVRREAFKEWLAAGFVKPSVRRKQGGRTLNIFNRNDLYSISTFKRLVKLGLSRKVAGWYSASVLGQMNGNQWPNFISCGARISEGKQFRWVRLGSDTNSLIQEPENAQWDMLLIVDTGKIRDQVDAALEQKSGNR